MILGRCAVVVEILAKNRPEADKVLRAGTKKIGGAFEKNILKMFERKAIVTAKAPEPGEMNVKGYSAHNMFFGEPRDSMILLFYYLPLQQNNALVRYLPLSFLKCNYIQNVKLK